MKVRADTLALSLTLGFLLGLCPVYGCPTLLCVVTALVLKLNLPLLQAGNCASTPLQIGLLPVFHQMGERILRYSGVRLLLHLPGAPRWFERFGAAAAHAIAGWFCVCVPIAILVYIALGYRFRRRMLMAPCTAN